ncbi:MAG: DMT family transporter [Candidatus Zambryskibacteria bacterium]|nr:DMT family transporter [Candidatus Zambryskibacteria bacterium]
MIQVGIGLSFVAMLCWGFGDFLIQKSSRKIGDWETLFFITFFGSIILIPFVWESLLSVITNQSGELFILIIASIVIFIAALIDFEALKEGKLSIVEPIWSLEVPTSAILAYFIISEVISVWQIILIIFLIIFLVLVAFKEKSFNKKFFLEKGVIIAFCGAFLMGAANFFMGWGGRISNPLMVVFFTNMFMVFATLIFIFYKGGITRLTHHLKNNYSLLLPMAIFDNVAWVAFVFGMSMAPIAVVTALSESYIIVAVLLGIGINKEKLQFHQKIGLVGAVVTAIILAVITSS